MRVFEATLFDLCGPNHFIFSKASLLHELAAFLSVSNVFFFHDDHLLAAAAIFARKV